MPQTEYLSYKQFLTQSALCVAISFYQSASLRMPAPLLVGQHEWQLLPKCGSAVSEQYVCKELSEHKIWDGLSDLCVRTSNAFS